MGWGPERVLGAWRQNHERICNFFLQMLQLPRPQPYWWEDQLRLSQEAHFIDKESGVQPREGTDSRVAVSFCWKALLMLPCTSVLGGEI